MKTRPVMTQAAPSIGGVDDDILLPGTPLLSGQYVIERYLSSGGFGITYLARDSLKRPVVIKECYPEALCTRQRKTVKVRSSTHTDEFQTLVRMFVREAGSLARLDHPNIVGVHQIFEDNETAYMALDLVEGKDLLTYIEQGRNVLTPDDIRVLLMKLLDAIGTVHAEDMLHRDISPDNILLDHRAEPVLIDFGAAREEASKKSRAISALLVVKDGYSPQEFYISGGQQGPASDLYSLAATFYHLITGTSPPISQERLAAMAAHRPDPYQPLLGQGLGFDERFCAAIDKAMAVFPADRIQSAEDWLAMIDGDEPVVPRPEASDIKRIVSRLVVEVDNGIDEDRQAAVEPVAEPDPAPRQLEYLTDPLSTDQPVGSTRPLWLRLLRGALRFRIVRYAVVAVLLAGSAMWMGGSLLTDTEPVSALSTNLDAS